MGSEFYFEIDNYLEDLENISDSDSSENDTIVNESNEYIFDR